MLVGKPAPQFTAEAVMPDGSFKKLSLADFKNQKVVLFFYPLDFTFVCPTEIIAFHNRIGEFQARKTAVLGCSVDSHFTHLAWRQTPVDKGGIGAIGYPLVSDLDKSIARSYGVLLGTDAGGNGGRVALRGTFLIDEAGNVRQETLNDLPLGRNIDETLRLVDALSFHQEHGEVCPAGWNKDKKGMKADAKGVAEYLAANAKGL